MDGIQLAKVHLLFIGAVRILNYTATYKDEMRNAYKILAGKHSKDETILVTRL